MEETEASDFGDFVSDHFGKEYDAERDFTTLECWKKARGVKLFFFNEILPVLPENEKFALSIQIRKAIVSITANIAEGYGRFHNQESVQFYRISRGSQYELKDHLRTCLDFKYIQQELYDKGVKKIEAAKMSLGGYIRYKLQFINKSK